jgi:hypothetical protein
MPNIEHGNIKGPWEVSQIFFAELNEVDDEIGRIAEKCLTPTCIFQGDGDKKVLPEDTKKFFGKLRGPKKLVTVHAGHDYTGAEAEVLAQMLAWFSEYV